MILVAHKDTSRKCGTRVQNFPKTEHVLCKQHVERRVYIQSAPKKNLQWEFQPEPSRGLFGGDTLDHTGSTNTHEDSMEM